MEENKISKKKEILTILLLTMVIATGTFAWIVWSSNDNTKINVTIGELADVSFKTGNDINIGNLSPSFYYDDGALTEFSIRKKKGLTTELNTNIYLDITSIDEELKNDNFKYVLLSSSDDNTYNEVASGSFKDASIGKLDIIKGSPLADNKTYYKFYIWIDGNNENNETMQGRSMKASLNVKVATPTANFVEELDDETTGDSGSGVYKVHHDAIPAESSATGEIIPAVDDYRYYGPSPNNYICLDMEGQSTCPDRGLFRIIGSMREDSDGTNKVKIVKATPLTDGTTNSFSWDSEGANIWATATNDKLSTSTTSGSSLMKLLNNEFLTSSNSYALSEIAKNYINISLFYLGGVASSNINTIVMYNRERGIEVYGTDNSKSILWQGNIGLIYPSDYGYAAGNSCANETTLYNYNTECGKKDWLFNGKDKWLLTPTNTCDIGAFFIQSLGNVFQTEFRSGDFNVRVEYSIHPTFYLKSDITLIGGTGTETDPYLVQ